MLPPTTEKVWDYLKTEPALAGFVLIGGSALALTLRHRLSEDLDFVTTQPRLPQRSLEMLQRRAAEHGFTFQANDDEAAIREFADSSLELHDYQQDFLVNGTVKVSFFTPDEGLKKVLPTPDEKVVKVASLRELFKAKALVSARRSKTRDWLDLFLLMRDHGFSLRDYRTAFEEAGMTSQFDIGLSRLCTGVPQRDDEGYSHLLTSPPTLDEMKAFFIGRRDQWEVEMATAAARRKQ